MGDPPDVKQEVAEYIAKEPAGREGKYGGGGYDGGGSWIYKWIIGGIITLIVIGGLLYWLTSKPKTPEEPKTTKPRTEVPPPPAKPQGDVGQGVPKEFPNFGVKLDEKVEYPPLNKFFAPSGETAQLNKALEAAGYEKGVRGVYSNGESGSGYTVAVVNAAQLESDASVTPVRVEWEDFITSLSTEPKSAGEGTREGFDYKVWVAKGPEVGTGFTDIYVLASQGSVVSEFNAVGPTGKITPDKALDNVVMTFEQWNRATGQGGAEPEQPPAGGKRPPPPPTTEPPAPDELQPAFAKADVQAFLDDQADAFRRGDAEFLLDTLAPEVTSLYGDDRCMSYVSDLKDKSREYNVLKVTGPGTWKWVADRMHVPVDNAYTVKFKGTTYDEPISGDIHLADSGGELRWFADCGKPNSGGEAAA